MSGIKLDSESKEVSTQIKDNKMFGYAVMKINADKTAIVVETKGEKHADRQESTTKASFDEMRAHVLKCEEPRYILADITYDRKSGGRCDAVVYIYWCPDTVPIGKKMIYAASNNTVKQSLSGIKQQLECHDDDDFSFSGVVALLKQKDRLE